MITIGLIVLGLVALVCGAELLVRGGSRLAAEIGVSSLIIGLTVVSFGTSAPEATVSVSSALSGQASIAVGNVVGSNIFNVLFILGVSAMIVPLTVNQRLIRFDVPLMIGVSLLLWAFSLDGNLGRIEGGILVGGLLAYTGWCLKIGQQESPAIQQEYATAFGSAPTATAHQKTPSYGRVSRLWWHGLMVMAGLGLLVLGGNWLVNGATQLARNIGISELVIGLTIVAAGTSLPEVATSLVAAFRGENDIAVGNVVGSNVFNILGVLGLSAAVAPTGVSIADQALQFHIPVMTLVAVACLPITFTGHQVARWEGALFVAYYVAYTATVVILANGSPVLPVFRLLMIGFVIPLTAVTLTVLAIRFATQQAR